MTFSCTADEYAAVLVVVSNSASTASTVCSLYDVDAVGVSGAVAGYTLQQLEGTQYGLNSLLLIFGAYGVFAMQVGFATFVAGAIRPKNIVSVMLKSTIDISITAIMFYTIGYGFASGGGDCSAGGFIGTCHFALSGIADVPYGWVDFVFNFVFCAVSTTIMAGAVAERCTFPAYAMYSAFYSGWVYPVFTHWAWSELGWLSVENKNAILGVGSIDVAGSGVVHILGGFAALVGSVVLGPRIGRWGAETERFYTTGQNPSLYLMGTFLLWFGWYFFNSSSLGYMDTVTHANLVARSATTTTLSAATAGLCTCCIVYWRTRTWNMLEICNGLLGGLVAITSGCAVVEPWAAVICGAIAAPCVVYGEQLLIRFKVDDPASSFSIHGLSGIWGMIFVGLLAKQEYILEAYSENGRTASSATMGLLYGGHGQLLLCQVIAIVVNISWVVFWMIPFFMLLNKLGLLRVPVDAEAVGIDAMQMGQTSKESDLISSAKVGGSWGRSAGGNHSNSGQARARNHDRPSAPQSVVGMSAIEVSNDQYINFNNGGMAKNEVAQVSTSLHGTPAAATSAQPRSASQIELL